jgi:hypothetical protein
MTAGGANCPAATADVGRGAGGGGIWARTRRGFGREHGSQAREGCERGSLERERSERGGRGWRQQRGAVDPG